MKASQRQKILSWLQEGHTLTPVQALNLFGCNRLAARIYNLRELGYPIDSEIIKVDDNTYVARYRLN